MVIVDAHQTATRLQAVELRDGGKPYMGKGVTKAVAVS
jgi:enolase